MASVGDILPPRNEEDRERMMFRRALGRKRRHEREAAGEIRELNIVAVTITPKGILVGDKRVVEIENSAIPARFLDGRRVVPLDQALKREVDKLKYIAARNASAPFNHELSIIGDRKIPYDLLLTVLYTAGQNELENYRFVVIQQEAEVSR